MKKNDQTVSEIIDLYRQYGHEQYGERVTQLQHMAQTAMLAEKEGYDEEVVLAAFLHDIGHFMGKSQKDHMGHFGVKSHDKLGADYLRAKGFGEKIPALVEGHVAAKRYLTFAKPEYYEKLSEASRQTLMHQGGKMTTKEAAQFEASPYFELSLKMRTWDDNGKVLDSADLNLEKYELMMKRFFDKNTHRRERNSTEQIY